MDTQTAGYQNKLSGAVAQTDYAGGLDCLLNKTQKYIYLNEANKLNKHSRGSCRKLINMKKSACKNTVNIKNLKFPKKGNQMKET